MSLSIDTNHITKKVKKKTIIEDLKLNIKEKSFIALIGPSGAGKTTLLNILSGYDKDFEGDVYYGQYNIKKDDLREQIAYVPQQEILHKDLTLLKELWYIAKIRMGHLSNEIINQKINKVIEDLELKGREHTTIKHLSGGEKKRLSIALELLFEPLVLILDEPTSGLDLHIEKKLMQLLKKISESGTTVIISAHTTANLNLCDEIFVMGSHGQICFEGTYQESLKYFKVKEFVDIYDLVIKDTKQYEIDYNQNWQKKKRNKGKLKIEKSKRNIFREIFYLICRHFEILWHDKFCLFMLIFQGIIIALLINFAVPKDKIEDYNSMKIVLFATSCAAMWIGLFNSVQEIIKEKNIIKREYMSTLNLNAFFISKVISFFFICFIQAILFIFVLFLHFDFPKNGLIFSSSYLEYITHFFFVCFTTCMLGLLISCIVKKQELSLILAILFMMLQLIFSGVLLPLEKIADKISYLILGRHAISLFGTTTNLIDIVSKTKLHETLDSSLASILFLDEAKKFFEYQKSHIFVTWIILIDMAIIFILVANEILKNKVQKNVES